MVSGALRGQRSCGQAFSDRRRMLQVQVWHCELVTWVTGLQLQRILVALRTEPGLLRRPPGTPDTPLLLSIPFCCGSVHRRCMVLFDHICICAPPPAASIPTHCNFGWLAFFMFHPKSWFKVFPWRELLWSPSPSQTRSDTSIIYSYRFELPTTIRT